MDHLLTCQLQSREVWISGFKLMPQLKVPRDSWPKAFFSCVNKTALRDAHRKKPQLQWPQYLHYELQKEDRRFLLVFCEKTRGMTGLKLVPRLVVFLVFATLQTALSTLTESKSTLTESRGLLQPGTVHYLLLGKKWLILRESMDKYLWRQLIPSSGLKKI